MKEGKVLVVSVDEDGDPCVDTFEGVEDARLWIANDGSLRKCVLISRHIKVDAELVLRAEIHS